MARSAPLDFRLRMRTGPSRLGDTDTRSKSHIVVSEQRALSALGWVALAPRLAHLSRIDDARDGRPGRTPGRPDIAHVCVDAAVGKLHLNVRAQADRGDGADRVPFGIPHQRKAAFQHT